MLRRARRKPAPGCTCKTARHTTWMRQQRHRAEQRSAFGLFPAAGAAEAHADQRRLVSPRLGADFSNGDQFYAKAGQVIDLPERRADRPRPGIPGVAPR